MVAGPPEYGRKWRKGGAKIVFLNYLTRNIKIDRTRVERFAVTCCEQSNKTCDPTIKALCVVRGFMFSTSTNEDFTYAKNVFY